MTTNAYYYPAGFTATPMDITVGKETWNAHGASCDGINISLSPQP